MSHNWATSSLAELLLPAEEQIDIQPAKLYKQITVRLWGKGVVLRGEVNGGEIATNRSNVARSGQFIMSRIDARNGAFGLVPETLEGAIVTNDFPLFEVNQAKLLPRFLEWISKTHNFVELCRRASEGTTNRVRLKVDRLLNSPFPLPPLHEQHRIVAHIEALAASIAQARGLRQQVQDEQQTILLGIYNRLTTDAKLMPMLEVAPLVRRPVDVKHDQVYHELGIRSFGNGTFHKSPITGLELGSKRVFQIEPGDLLFSNVFAWEGAIAVAKSEDKGRIGSHRFITCVPKDGVATARFLCFHFLTPKGLHDIGQASPGGAGRNRTLGLEKLERIMVPVPDYEKQVWFNDLYARIDTLKRLQAETAAELDALLPAVLDRAFRGELV